MQVDSQESQQGGVLMLQSADDAEPDSSASKPCATQDQCSHVEHGLCNDEDKDLLGQKPGQLNLLVLCFC